MKSKGLPELRRRDFLAYGSSGVLSLALTASGAKAARHVLPTPAPAAEFVSIGYVPGSARLAQIEQSINASGRSAHLPGQGLSDTKSVHAPRYPHLMAAEAMSEGDSQFAHTGARVSIHGLYPPESSDAYADLKFWGIDVECKAARCTPMFHAWCFQNTIVPQSSSAAQFVMPIVDALSLSLSIHRTPQPQAATRASADNPPPTQQLTRLELSLGRERNRPKLQRGIYVIALPSPQTGTLPKWNEYQLRAAIPDTPELATELYRRGQPTRDHFAYVRLVVDYADNPTPALV